MTTAAQDGTQRRPTDISVVVPSRNRPRELARCLAALHEQRTEASYEVIVVDDGSSPPLDGVLTPDPRLRVVRGPGRGPARARNAALQVARGAIVAFTDDDTIPDSSWLAAALSYLNEHPEAVGVEGPTHSTPFDYLEAHSVDRREPGGYVTANIAFRRSILLLEGGFSDEFPAPHCEDLDLAFRCLRHGPIGFAPGMLVTHPPRPLTARQIIWRGGLGGSDIKLFRRHRDRFPVYARSPPIVLLPARSAWFWLTELWRRRRSAFQHGQARKLLAVAIGQFTLVLLTAMRLQLADVATAVSRLLNARVRDRQTG